MALLRFEGLACNHSVSLCLSSSDMAETLSFMRSRQLLDAVVGAMSATSGMWETDEFQLDENVRAKCPASTPISNSRSAALILALL